MFVDVYLRFIFIPFKFYPHINLSFKFLSLKLYLMLKRYLLTAIEIYTSLATLDSRLAEAASRCGVCLVVFD